MALLPHSYFRFISLQHPNSWDRLERTFRERILYTSNVARFNDPFEAKPVLIGRIQTNIQVSSSSANSSWGFVLRNVLSEIENEVHSIKDIIDYVRRKISVVSLSRRVNSGLMWSHYADGYRGIALHFVPSNSAESYFREPYLNWISYEKQRPFLHADKIYHLLDKHSTNSLGTFAPDILGAIEIQLMSALFCWKSEEWAYEQEARIVAPPIEAVPFAETDLESVIVGPLCPEEHVVRIREILMSLDNPPTMAQATLSRTDYTVEIDWNRFRP